MDTHFCKYCQKELPIEKFNVNKTYKLGISNQCKKCKSIYDKKYRLKLGQEYLDRNKKYRDENRDIINQKQRSPEHLERRRIWRKEKMKNKEYALKEKLNARIRTAMNSAVKGVKDKKSWKSILGYDWRDLKNHLESKFQRGMTWDLFLEGKIHIDHIRPIFDFSFTREIDDEFLECWSLSNLQPLWAEDNMRKGKRLDYA